MRKEHSVVDLFCGAGGMSTGFYLNGFKLLGAVDYEIGKPSSGPGTTGSIATYQRNLGLTPKFADIGKLDPIEYREELGVTQGQITVLISCPPCTGFSQKNALNHTRDDVRNSLVARTSQFVEAFRPEWLVMENVVGMLTGANKMHWEYLRETLEDLGYNVFYDIFELGDFGIAQRRTRVLVIARRDRQAIPRIVPGHPQASTVRDAIGWLPPISHGTKHNAEYPMHICPGFTPPNLARVRHLTEGQTWKDLPYRLRTTSQKDPNRRPGKFEDTYGRMWWDQPAVTLTRECAHLGNGRYLHPEQDRLMSVLEAALLQGFPVDYYFEGILGNKYRQIGDAVPPKVSYELAKAIRLVLETGSVLDPIHKTEQVTLQF